MKLGCGQSELSATFVSRAAGAKVSTCEPVNTRSARNVNGFSGASPADYRSRAAELGVNAVGKDAWHADARRERQGLRAVQLHGRGLLEAGHVADRQDQHGVAPAYRHGVRIDVRHVGRLEAAFERQVGREHVDVENRAVQHARGRLAVDRQILGQEDRAPLLHLLDAFVAVLGHDPHHVGHGDERPRNLLGSAPGARHVGLDRVRAALALGYERDHHQKRDEQQKNEEADQEELEAGAAGHAPHRCADFRHGSAASLEPMPMPAIVGIRTAFSWRNKARGQRLPARCGRPGWRRFPPDIDCCRSA